MNSNSSSSHENIARRAHQIWQEAGQPEGREEAHWQQAEGELRAEPVRTGAAGGAQRHPAGPPASVRPVPEKPRHSTPCQPAGVTADSLHHHRER